ncbi:hypothetical protein OIU85_007731 [Salix viminalis]|uniref:Uncharacterized protein n=1 Tax=Salix viminalis TaxID=40686 RepID=A0A9Q0P9S3_SALVM|nr:hypothetical protein OIU85_007731 [Salix viminalis]
MSSICGRIEEFNSRTHKSPSNKRSRLGHYLHQTQSTVPDFSPKTQNDQPTTDIARSSRDPVRSKSAMFLRAIGRPLLARVKQTTGIVGLDVVPNARAVLINLYTKTLKEIEAVPQDEGYRKAVESFTRHRLTVCEEEEEWEKIEERIGCGQVEELIEEAQDELKLIGKMIEWDPWGVPDDYECEIIENDAPIPKHVPRHVPGPLPCRVLPDPRGCADKTCGAKGRTCCRIW